MNPSVHVTVQHTGSLQVIVRTYRYHHYSNIEIINNQDTAPAGPSLPTLISRARLQGVLVRPMPLRYHGQYCTALQSLMRTRKCLIALSYQSDQCFSDMSSANTQLRMEANRPSGEHVHVAGSMNNSSNHAKETNDEEQSEREKL